MNWLIVSLLSIVMVQPEKMCFNNELCNSLYTPSTVHIESCMCNESTHTYVFSPGFKTAVVNYNLSYPIQHDFYQSHTLVGTCPKGLYCSLIIPLKPSLHLVSTIREYLPYNETDVDTEPDAEPGAEPDAEPTRDDYDLFLRGV